MAIQLKWQLILLLILIMNSTSARRYVLPNSDNDLFEEMQWSLPSCISLQQFDFVQPNCTFYRRRDASFNAKCIGPNVFRIQGEFKVIKIICGAEYPLDFKYYGIQPTEAISVEYYKKVKPGSKGKLISSFSIEIRISSIEHLFQFYSNQSKGSQTLTKQSYTRTGNYIFESIFNTTQNTNFFIYFEEPSTKPSFLENARTKITIKEKEGDGGIKTQILMMPCIPSHFNLRNLVTIEKMNDETGQYLKDERFLKHSDSDLSAFQGFVADLKDDENGHGRFKCSIAEKPDLILYLEFPSSSRRNRAKCPSVFLPLNLDPENDIREINGVRTPQDCCQHCLAEPKCRGFTHDSRKKCWLKRRSGPLVPDHGFWAVISAAVEIEEEGEYAFGLDRPLPSKLGQNIRYHTKMIGENIEIQIGCKVHKLGDVTFFSAIETENYAMMNLKREFIFPKFINRSYTAVHALGNSNALKFEVKLPKPFKSRTGGLTYCSSGENFQLEEFVVSFQDVSKHPFAFEWPNFNRENSSIGIHFEISILPNSSTGPVVYSGAESTFKCKFIKAVVVKPAVWYTISKNGSRLIDYDWKGLSHDTSYFTKIIHSDVVAVDCSATFYYASFWKSIRLPLLTQTGEKPIIDSDKSSSSKLTFGAGSTDRVLKCTANGRPSPEIKWVKDGQELPAIKTGDGSSSLLYQFVKVDENQAGEYICSASNIYGNDEKKFEIVVTRDMPTMIPLLAIIIPVVVIIFTVIGGYVLVNFFKKEKNGMTKAEQTEFLMGQLKNTPPHDFLNYANEFAHLVPYDKSYEIPPEKFQIDQTTMLGTGAFGLVFKGIVDGNPVTVKTTKKDADKAYLKALLSELKIMIYLGQHENLVQLIGASTKDLANGYVYIFVCYYPLGNLEKFLRKNRDNYLDENHYVLGGEASLNCFCIEDLLRWARQIASGMAYLAEKKVIHGDLAARNILLSDFMVAKITDFGLSRQLYDYAEYVKKHQEPLPWRWMAIEALSDLTFSTQSDVWSYGITLWEIFSLGEVPYPGLSWTLEFVQELKNGLRMGKPKLMPTNIYDAIVRRCWENRPDNRINFSEMISIFGQEMHRPVSMLSGAINTSDGECKDGKENDTGDETMEELELYVNSHSPLFGDIKV